MRVVLSSPAGESVVLHDRAGGSSRDITETYTLESHPGLSVFVGDEVSGNWTLSVSDHAAVDTGKLMFWELELSMHRTDKRELTKDTDANLRIPDNSPEGVESLIEISETGSVVRLDVPVDISHTWVGDLRVSLVSPAGTEVILHNRSGRSRHNIQRVYSTTTDGALVALIGSAIQGTWRLRVVDTYSRDTGTLNSWGIHCVFEQ